MKKIHVRNLTKALIIMLSIAFCVSSVMAETSEQQAVSSAKRVKAEIKLLRKLARKSKVRIALAALSSRGWDDSDSDGLSDVLEDAMGTNSCDDDSDHDGISDHDEGSSGSNPDDSSSGEIELKDFITAITDTTVTVGGKVFTVSDSTEFERGATSLASFHVGDKVEISGRLVSGLLTIRKIKTDD